MDVLRLQQKWIGSQLQNVFCALEPRGHIFDVICALQKLMMRLHGMCK
jgi:hypothetical protein